MKYDMTRYDKISKAISYLAEIKDYRMEESNRKLIKAQKLIVKIKNDVAKFGFGNEPNVNFMAVRKISNMISNLTSILYYVNENPGFDKYTECSNDVKNALHDLFENALYLNDIVTVLRRHI